MEKEKQKYKMIWDRASIFLYIDGVKKGQDYISKP